MASSASWLEAAKQSLEENGFYQLLDSEVGEHVAAFESAGFPYGTSHGLGFIEGIIFDPRVRDILKAYRDKYTLGHCVRYTAKPGRYFRFWPGGPNSDLLFVVHQWAKGSYVDYWAGSQKVALPILAPRLDAAQQKVMEPLIENTKEALIAAGCTPWAFPLPEGGLIITDARTSFEHKTGYEFANVFFPPNRLPDLPMPLPNSPELVEKAKNMKTKSGEIGINFEIKILKIPDAKRDSS